MNSNVSLLACFAPVIVLGAIAAQGAQPRVTSLSSSAYSHARRLDFHFTLEVERKAFDVKSRENVFSIYHIDLPGRECESIESFIEMLREADPRIRVRMEKGERPILHISDGDLANLPDNPLDREPELSFRGTTSELIDHLRSLDPRFASKNARFDWSRPNLMPIDWDSRVDVRAEGKPLRDVLTHCVIHDDDNRCIWEAHHTIDDSGDVRTGFAFLRDYHFDDEQ